MVMVTASLASVKARLSSFVDDVEVTHERVVITRNGSPAAVLVAPEDLESLEETIAVLSDPDAMVELTEARAAIAKGDLTPIEEVVLRIGTTSPKGRHVPGAPRSPRSPRA
jgi:prevent-host-death family protein